MRPFPAAPAAVLLSLLATVSPAAEASRTLRVELSGDPARSFAVENLAGSMRVVAADVGAVVAVATVHGESDELVSSMRFEQVTGEHGVPTLRVRYPLERHTSYRFGTARSRERSSAWGWLEALFDGGSWIKYDGRRVSVSSNRGVLLYADVEVQVPRRRVEGLFKNAVGPVDGEGVQGRLRFDTGSGTVTLRSVSGEVVADTGSGDVHAVGVKGEFRCDTGSGDCQVDGFQGTRLSCDTGSGEIRVRAAEADEVGADTGSGDVEIQADARVSRIKADTGSGDVRLRLGPEAGFELRADTGSGDVTSGYRDAEPIRSDRRVVGYRRGDRRIRIDVDTGSGDVEIEPQG